MQLETLIGKVVDFADASGVGVDPAATSIPSLSVARNRAPTTMSCMTYTPIFCLVLQGEKQALIGERTLKFGRMELLIVNMHLPALSRITKASAAEPYVALAFALDLSLARALAEEICPAAEADGMRAAATLAADADILDAMGRLFALAERPAAASVLAPLVAREIHYWLLNSRHGGLLRSLAQADLRASRIMRAISVIRRDFHAPIAVADLAQTAAMSLSAFHHHFRAITGLTPLQFQKQLRLSEARRLMLAEDRSIAAAAFAVGYESTTQFTREYARQFGAPRAATCAPRPSALRPSSRARATLPRGRSAASR